MEIESYRSTKVLGVFSAVNDVPWLKNLWALTIFALLCGFAFFAIPLGGFHITAGRVMLFIFLPLFLFTFLLHQGRISINIRVSRYVLFLALWLLWAVVSLFWAPYHINLARHIEALVIGPMIVAFSLLFFSTEKGIKNLYHLWVISALIFIGIGVWELTTGKHMGGIAVYELLGFNYPRAVFFHHNSFGVFLSISFPFLYILAAYSKNILVKMLGLLAILLSFYFIVLGDVRGAMIGIIVGIFVMFLVIGWTAKFKLIFVGLIATVVLILSSYALPRANAPNILDLALGVPQRIGAVVQPYSSYSPLSSFSNRQSLISNGLLFLGNSHYLGIGAGSFEYYMQTTVQYEASGTINPHNWWLEILVDYGVLIFGLFMAFFVGLLWNLFHVFRQSRSNTLRMVALATFISLVIFSIANVSASGLMRTYFVWLLFATALCVINSYRLGERNNQIGEVAEE